VQKFTTAYGEDGQRYLEGLRKECGANLYWHLAEILSYQELYSPEDITAAIKKCLEIGSFHKNSVKVKNVAVRAEERIKEFEMPFKAKAEQQADLRGAGAYQDAGGLVDLQGPGVVVTSTSNM